MEAIAVPVELEHAERHMALALEDWKVGRMTLARMHLREAICDAAWALYCATVDIEYPEWRPTTAGDNGDAAERGDAA